jgi:cobaltochelatase CobS
MAKAKSSPSSPSTPSTSSASASPTNHTDASYLLWPSGSGGGEEKQAEEDLNLAPLGACFGIDSPANFFVEIAKPAPNLVKRNPDPNYYFDKLILKKLLNWVYGTSARRNLLLIGDAGVGKSSLIVELATRLNLPLYQLACSGKTRFQHLVGSRELVAGETRWADGPLTRAMREGGILLMDEVTRMDAGEQMNLASVLDGRSSLTIPDTGEVVIPHPRFRVAATGNSGGFGDNSGAYIGEKASSLAFLDRFQKIVVSPLPEEEEKKLLKRTIENADEPLSEEILSLMMRLAKEIRANFVGAGGGLSVNLSPRSLQVWAMEAVSYKRLGIDQPILEALRDTVLNGAPADNVKTIEELYNKWI